MNQDQKLKDAKARLTACVVASNDATEAFRISCRAFINSTSAANYDAMTKRAQALQDARFNLSEARQALRSVEQEKGA